MRDFERRPIELSLRNKLMPMSTLRYSLAVVLRRCSMHRKIDGCYPSLQLSTSPAE
jgi:hypothetical protein